MKQPSPDPLWRAPLRHLRGRLTTGLLLLVPLVITYWILSLIFQSVDGLLQPLLEHALGTRIPGLGLAALLIMVYLAGLVASNFLGRWLIRMGQGALLRVPLVSTVYSASRQLIESFSGRATDGFKRVVALQYPRAGAWTIGFLTGTTRDETGRPMAIIYIPTAPTPTSGWVAILPAEDVYDTDLTVQTAIRLVLSGGIICPHQIKGLPSA